MLQYCNTAPDSNDTDDDDCDNGAHMQRNDRIETKKTTPKEYTYNWQLLERGDSV